jgi:hypothetical protein
MTEVLLQFTFSCFPNLMHSPMNQSISLFSIDRCIDTYVILNDAIYIVTTLFSPIGGAGTILELAFLVPLLVRLTVDLIGRNRVEVVPAVNVSSIESSSEETVMT